MNYVGDFPEDQTVYIPFNTFTSDDPSASATITDLVDADIKVHKDGNATEIVTDGATIAIDFDGVTGNHLVTVDTSVHSDFSTGSDYLVRINGTTVDGATINAWVGSFSIENRFMRGTDNASASGEPASALAAIKLDHLMNIAVDTNLPTTVHDNSVLGYMLAKVNVSNYVRTNAALQSLYEFAINAEGNIDTVDSTVNTILEDTNAIQGKLPTNKFMGSSDGADDDSTLNTIATDAARLTAARAGVLTDWINGGRLDSILDIIAADTTTDIPTLIAALPTVDEIWAKAMQDLGAIPGATASALDALNILFMALRNKQTATDGAQTIGNNAGATIATAALDDAAGTTTKEKYA